MSSEEVKAAVKATLNLFIEEGTADLKEFAGELAEEGKKFLKDSLEKIASYTLNAEVESDAAEKDGWQHRIRAVISSATSEVSIKTAEARAFAQGLLSMAKSALGDLIPVLVKTIG